MALSPSLQRLVTTLSKLGLTSSEIAEAIWLAAQTEAAEVILDVPAVSVPEPSPLPVSEAVPPPLVSVEPPPPLPQAEIVPMPAGKPASVALPPTYTPISVPDAPAISQALVLARSLRPLARQVAVGLPTLLDEAATVDSVAETGLWQPVLKPESELWLDVALVFDMSASMSLWQRLGADLYRLLARYGEFRDVRIWRLQPLPNGDVQLTARNRTVHRPSELLTGDRRRLVVIVSDCVAPVWHTGTMRSLVATWSAKLPTVVLQVFPERLWSRTALARSILVELQGKQPGLPSDSLQPEVRSVWDQARLAASLRRSGVRLPVVTLEQDALSNWAQVVAGDRRFRTLGLVWDAPPATLPAPPPASLSPSVVQERIDTFLMLASPTARQLAGLLASAPVITLPIARLIQQSMLPDAGAVHLAEVFMSGLLKVGGDQVATFKDAEKIAYELVDDEVRDRLRAGSLVVDVLTVLQKVSNYIAKGLGKSVSEFRALLRSPGSGTTTAETEFLHAFATVTAKILRGLGGEFAAIADELSLPAAASAAQPFPALEILEFTTGQLVEANTEIGFPPLQMQVVEVVTIEIETETDPAGLQQFEFEVATIERNIEPRQTGFLQNLFRRGQQRGEQQPAWVIRKQRRQAYQWVRPLGEDLQLSMVAIPAGSFLMGSPENEPERLSSEGPQHEVRVAAFFMGRYPITQAQWRFLAGLPQINRKLDPDPSRFKGDTRPVERVSWYDAIEFCDRLSVYTATEYRLPTEAEWEYACRAAPLSQAGTLRAGDAVGSGQSLPFHFGETISPEVANYNGNYTYNDGPKGEYREETTPVDHFGIANAFGLCDLHGNVYEWCLDHSHENYEGAPTDGSAWLRDDESSSCVLRGGSWLDYPGDCRSAYRSYDSPDYRNVIGFRVVCSALRTL